MRRVFIPLILAAFAVAVLHAVPAGQSPAGSQAPCRAPAPEPSKVPNIFSPAQEMDLSDAIAERFESWLRVIDDPALTSRLDAIGARLVSHLPPTDLKFRFYLIDLPDANAFSIAGGRVYVARKLIAFTQSEDELAGILGHELGHVVARQHTIEETRRLREIIGVTEVGDRNDIFAKYNQAMDNAARKPGVFAGENREGRDQIEADRIGLFIVAAAGYDPKALVTLFDRYAETGGKTGSALSHMFGTTNPDAKRLGELMKTVGAIQPGCADPPNPQREFQYRAWQEQVAAFATLGRQESLPGLISQKALTPIRADITDLRFSPDGKYLLAQDDAGLSVLSREPLAVLFRISNAEAEPAQFSSDSREVIVHTRDLRIERWSISTKQIAAVRDLFRPGGCLFAGVAPDGKTAACLNGREELSLIDVATGRPFFLKKNFQLYSMEGAYFTYLSGFGLRRGRGTVNFAFSPDGHYFAGTSVGYSLTSTVVYDLVARVPITVKGNARPLLNSTFTFVAPDRLVGFNADDPAKSGVIQLPSGEVVEQFTLPAGTLGAAAHGNVVFVRPYQRLGVGVYDITKKTVVRSSANEAIDVFDDAYAVERGTGDVGIFAMEGNALRSIVTVPSTELARLRSAAVSPNFGWVAVSNRTRGALWNATTGERVAMLRYFDGSFVDDVGALFVDLPRSATEPHAIMKLDPQTRVLGRVAPILDRYASQYGQQFLILRTIPPDTAQPTGVEFEMRDVSNGLAMWRKAYPKNGPDDYWPSSYGDGFVMSWQADSPTGREVIRLHPDLRERAKIGDIAGDFIFEVIDNRTGAMRGHLLVETGKGSFRVEGAVTAGDCVIVTDSLGRVLVYSLSKNELKGYAFGTLPLVNMAANIMAISAGADRIVTYDLQTLKRLREFQFGSDVITKALSADGTKLFALTANQKTSVLAVR